MPESDVTIEALREVIRQQMDYHETQLIQLQEQLVLLATTPEEWIQND